VKVLWSCFVAVAVLASTGICGYGAAELKIAVVDMGRVLEAHPKTQSDRTVIEKEVEEFEREQGEMMADLKKHRQEIEAILKDADNKALNEETRAAKKELAETKVGALRDKERSVRETIGDRQKQLQDQRVRMLRRVVSDVRQTIGEYAANKGYTVVLDSSGVGMNGSESVVYAVDKIDITEDVLKLISDKKTNSKEKSTD
jgi:outer membrane protein